MDSDMNNVDDGDTCPFCNVRRGEWCGLEEYDEQGKPKYDPLPCAVERIYEALDWNV
jgi:hypothetical protein